MKNAIIFFLLTFASCGFLEEQSNDLAYASSCQDLDEILIGSGYMAHKPFDPSGNIGFSEASPYCAYLHVMADEAENVMRSGKTATNWGKYGTLAGFYKWDADPYNEIGSKRDDYEWKRLYKHINNLNVILSEIDNFEDKPLGIQSRLRGESCFLRAEYYFLLANLYALPYEQEKASSTLGVPLKLTEFVEEKYFGRETLENVYKQIVKDLQDAAGYLKGVKQSSIYRANEAACQVLLSRVYLYMGEWELALKACERAEEIGGYTLLDISRGWESDFLSVSSPEMIFSQGIYSAGITFGWARYGAVKGGFVPSKELLGSFDQTNDQRYKSFFAPHYEVTDILVPVKVRKDGKGATYQGIDVSDCFQIRWAEVLLNKMEALAMLDRDNEAKTLLRELFSKRYALGTEPDVNGLIGKGLVDYIRKERYRELCFEGHRWFDLRRYAVSSKYPDAISLKHEEYGNQNTLEKTYLLRAYPEGSGWVFPIPDYELEYNRETMENNKRGDAEII